MYSTNEIRKNDPQLADAIEMEVERQRNKIELIASENFVSNAVMEAINTLGSNKTMIIVAHRLTTIEKCDHVYRVVDGALEQTR